MITNTKILKKYCTDYKNIENYEEAVKSPLKYDLHHRLEISEMQSASDLIAENLYYNRPPEELIFLEHSEHARLHTEGKPLSVETKQKISEALKGKPLSAETRKKMSENNSRYWKGKPGTCLGKHWHTEDGHRIWTD